MHKLHNGALPKIYNNVFQNISSVHSYKPVSMTTKNIYTKCFHKFYK